MVKKGFLVVQVGLEDEFSDNKMGFQRFEIPISYLYHPRFTGLLDRAREVFGYHADGPLRLPCSVDDFIHLRWQIEKETGGGSGSGGVRHHSHHQFSRPPSFRSC